MAKSPTVRAKSDNVLRNATVLLAVIAGGAALYWLRGILTPLALAIFLAIMIDGVTRRLKAKVPKLPNWAALTITLVVALAAIGLSVFLVADAAPGFINQLIAYGPRLEGLIDRLAGLVGVQTPPSIDQIFNRLNPLSYMGQVAQGLQGFAADAVFVLIYLGFLIASRAGWDRKVVRLFPERSERQDAARVFNRIREGIERYLWIQTVTGLMIAVASWAIMAAVGLDNAVFWAFLIFVAGYIPIVGGAVGTLLPPVFALVQFTGVVPAIVLFVTLNIINFVVANVIQPRMQGDSLNVDPVVVLLALAFWGALWGVAGMFLSTPLAVMTMVILAQFEGSRPIAILLSGNGDPEGREPPRDAG